MNVQGHEATIDDIGTIHRAIKVLNKLGFANIKDVEYVDDLLRTIIMVEVFEKIDACDSRLQQHLLTLKKEDY
jgi:hypothetical protein